MSVTGGEKRVRRTGAPTVQDVAELAGVSPMTVSRVLGGGVNVRPEKIEAVLAAVEALGYRRNENARSIRPGQRTGLLGVIITNVGNPYYAQLQLGAEEIVAQDGLRLLVGNSGEDVARERALVNDFIGRHVDGLIVVPAGREAGHLQAAMAARIPLVLASRQLSTLDTDAVLVDDHGGALEATRRLISEGHERIAYVGNAVSVFTSQRRFEGFTRAHEEAGLAVDDTLVRAGQNDADAARVAMRELLALTDPPTAVFSANNRNTIGVLRALAESGARDARIIAFDDFELSDMTPYELSVIEHDPRDVGRRAAELILERLHGDTAPTRVIELPTRLRL
jgi:LacI family transcriptional regulator